MNTLIDITSLHRIGKILDSKKQETVRATDVVALLHFIELILFSDNIYYVKIDNDKTSFETVHTINKLIKYGCIPKNKLGKLILQPLHSNHIEYFEYSKNAAYESANIINTLNQENFFNNIPFYFDEASQPKGITVNNIFNILNSKKNQLYKSEDYAIEMIKNDVANGTIEAMIRNNPALSMQLQNLYKKPNKQFDLVFRTIFRIKINENIAKKAKCIYSPAPQRARFEQIMHNSIITNLNRSILELREELTLRKNIDGVLSEFTKNEKLPLPAIAMGVLMRTNKKEPIELLQWIQQYRQKDNEISEVRHYLSKLETTNINGDYHKKRKVKNNIEKIMKEVKSDINEQSIKSIFRTGIKGFLNFIGINFEQEISEDELDNLEKIFSLRKNKINIPVNFLSMTTENLLSEPELGAWLLKSFNRNIVYKKL